MKKSNVLSLEVEAYEKSLKELSEKLDSHVKQLTEAKNENEKLTEIIQTLRNDILKLKNELDLEKQNSTGNKLYFLVRKSTVAIPLILFSNPQTFSSTTTCKK